VRLTPAVGSLLFLLVTLVPAAAVPGASGRLNLSLHPSFQLVDLQPELRSAALPLGLAPLAGVALESVKVSRGDLAEPTADLGSVLARLQFPQILPFSVPSSPTLLTLTISSNEVRLESEGGEIQLGETIGRLSRARQGNGITEAPLVPLLSLGGGSIRLAVGLGLTGDPVRIRSLEGVDASGGLLALLPGQSYVEVGSLADMSVGFRVTAGRQIQTGRVRLVPAVALRVPLSLVHVESIAGLRVTRDEVGLPQSSEVSWNTNLWYPGNGFAVGMGIDVGMAVWVRDSLFGIAVRNAAAFEYVESQIISSGSTLTSGAASTWVFNPELVLTALAEFPERARGLNSMSAVASWTGSLAIAATLVASIEGVRVVSGLGFDRGVMFGLGLGVSLGSIYLEPSMEIRTDELTGTAIVGLAVQIARTRRPDWRRR
jgi:hypothetical protein